jgi:hypothetical protein
MASDGAPVDGGPNLVPHENRFGSLIPASEEGRLRQSYNILDSVTFHFQEPGQLSIASNHRANVDGRISIPFHRDSQGTASAVGGGSISDKTERMKIHVCFFHPLKDQASEEDVCSRVPYNLPSWVPKRWYGRVYRSQETVLHPPGLEIF